MSRRTTEHELVARLRRVFGGASGRGRVIVGIGDDAAVLSTSTEPLVWTVDVAVEHVHFERSWLTLSDIGARSFHAAVSDLAAMGATPVAALSSLVVPSSLSSAGLSALARGQAAAAREIGCPVVGGNLSRGGELSVTTTALGVAAAPLLRSGARAGDEVWLVGDVGLAAAGLRCLSAPVFRRDGARPRGAERRALAACIAAWRRPRALVGDGLGLVGRATACIDVSDGLAGDLRHVARESGVRIVIDGERLESELRPELLVACSLLGLDAQGLALGGGEDYALAATGPGVSRPAWARVIGRVERGRGVQLTRPDGTRTELHEGFDHFRGAARRRAPRPRP